jgi:DNA segregation ATPase FtsK/SpoIIIE-like protein
MKNPFRILLCATLIFTVISGAFAQNVDRDELEKNQATVNFLTYEGPHSQIDTVEQIRQIGFALGRQIKNGAARAGAGNRYFVIHCISGPDGDKFDADVFGLGVDVGVDHIRNLRLIIQGYLQGAYDYSASDAALLSRYVTIYNAVFRGDWDFFTGRYKNLVVENLEQAKAGLSIRYDEWPGQTLMTIPLGTGSPGSLSAIDTSGLTDPNVIDSLRTNEDRGIGDRQDMVDLKEREADEANQSATLQREAIAEEEKNIQQDQEQSTRAQQRIEQQQNQAQQQRTEAQQQQQEAQRRQEQARRDEEAGRISREEAQKQQQEAQKQEQEAQQRQQELAKEQQAQQQQQEEITQRQQQQEQARQEADTTQQRADQKTAEAQEERQQIAKDQQEIIDGTAIASATPDAGRGNNLLGAGILQTKSSLGRLVRIDPSNGSTVQTSQMNTVNTRTVVFSGTRIFAIAGINRRNGAVRLVEISNDTLEMLKQGDDDINENSLLWVNGSSFYAITAVKGKNYLARFDNNLAKQAQSTVEVHPYASCLFHGDRVLTQSTNGNPLFLNAQTLE